jgi:aspartate aminotransferase
MTGWRIGYASGPVDVIKAMNNIQSQSTSNASSISQAAAEAALRGGLESTQAMVKVFKERHDYLVDSLNAIKGVECLKGDGTFYAFPSFEKVIQGMGMKSDLQLADHLISTVGLALVPGSAFGKEGYMRLSFATGMDTLEKAVERLRRACT